MIEWIEDHRCSVKYTTVRQRLSMGWSHEEAVMRPRLSKIAIDPNTKKFLPHARQN